MVYIDTLFAQRNVKWTIFYQRFILILYEVQMVPEIQSANQLKRKDVFYIGFTGSKIRKKWVIFYFYNASYSVLSRVHDAS